MAPGHITYPPREADGRGTMDRRDLEVRGGCSAPGQGRHGGGGNGGGGGDGGIRAPSSRIRRDPAVRDRFSRRGRGALFHGALFHSRSVIARGRNGDEGSGEVRSGSPGIDDGEVVPDSEEDEGYADVPDSEEEEGYADVPDSEEEERHADVPDSEDAGVASIGGREDSIAAKLAAGDVPDAIASSLNAMEEQYRDVALSMYKICFSTFFKTQ